MLLEEWGGFEIAAAGMADARDETHGFGHVAVHHFALHGAGGLVGSSGEAGIAGSGDVTVAA